MAFKMKGWSAFTKKTDTIGDTPAAQTGAAEAAAERVTRKDTRANMKDMPDVATTKPRKQPEAEQDREKTPPHRTAKRMREDTPAEDESPMTKKKSPYYKDKTHYKETDSDKTRGTIGGAHREKVGKEKPGGKTKEFKATTTLRGGTEYTKTKGGKTKNVSKKKFEQKQKQYGEKKNVENRTKQGPSDEMMWEYGTK